MSSSSFSLVDSGEELHGSGVFGRSGMRLLLPQIEDLITISVWYIQCAVDWATHDDVVVYGKSCSPKRSSTAQSLQRSWYTDSMFDGQDIPWHISGVHSRYTKISNLPLTVSD